MDSSDNGSTTDPGEPRTRLTFQSDKIAAIFRDRFDATVAIDVEPVINLPDGSYLQYWTFSGTPPETVQEMALTLQTPSDARLLRTVGDAHQLEVRVTPDSVYSVFDEFDGVAHSAEYDGTSLFITVEFPGGIDIETIRDAIQEIRPDLEFHASREVRTRRISQYAIREQLSDQQQLALKLAYYSGYYEQPRKTSGKELAGKMGISRQTFHEHLRKAYAVVFEQLFETGETSPLADM
ncbi:MAG: bacterio-opsin activator domain-containing protein [Halobacteriales archaeon]